jgi:ABC-2 type transport system permease protein
VRKDISAVLRNRGVRIPMLVAPIVLLVGLPILLVGGMQFLQETATTVMTGEQPVTDAPAPEVLEGVTGEEGLRAFVVFILEVFLAPLYLLVPLVVATVIAADSFAGERERRTLEALLHSPASDSELLVGKLLAAWIPAVTVGLVGFAVYSVVANAVAWPVMGEVFFPSRVWVLLAVWVAPALSALGLGVMVLVSSRVQSLQAAHQLGSIVVLPIVLLVIAQVTGVVLISLPLAVGAGTVLWLAVMLLLWRAVRGISRDRLAARL